MRNPLFEIRKFLKSDPVLKSFSSQRAFAELVDCSQALIQSVEQGKLPVSGRLAKMIETHVGVDHTWTLDYHPGSPIRARDGSPLTPSYVRGLISKEIEKNDLEVEKLSSGTMPPSSAPPGEIAAWLAREVYSALSNDLARGDFKLMSSVVTGLQERSSRLSSGDKAFGGDE